jgi:hypothetical protein
MQINRSQQESVNELESTMSSTATTQQRRFLVSPDGMLADWVHPLDPKQPRHEGWIDCTDMDGEALQRFIAERQATRPRIVGVKVGA